jgi:hypothetical protein
MHFLSMTTSSVLQILRHLPGKCFFHTQHLELHVTNGPKDMRPSLFEAPSPPTKISYGAKTVHSANCMHPEPASLLSAACLAIFVHVSATLYPGTRASRAKNTTPSLLTLTILRRKLIRTTKRPLLRQDS